MVHGDPEKRMRMFAITEPPSALPRRIPEPNREGDARGRDRGNGYRCGAKLGAVRFGYRDDLAQGPEERRDRRQL